MITPNEIKERAIALIEAIDNEYNKGSEMPLDPKASEFLFGALSALVIATRREQIELLTDAKEVFELCDPGGNKAKHIIAPEDPMIKQLCERIGYGAVISSAARQWWLKDPIGAHTAGPCAGTVSLVIERIDAALKATKGDDYRVSGH